MITPEHITRLRFLAIAYLSSRTNAEARLLEPDDLVNTAVMLILEDLLPLGGDFKYVIHRAADKLLGNGLTNRLSRNPEGVFRETANPPDTRRAAEPILSLNEGLDMVDMVDLLEQLEPEERVIAELIMGGHNIRTLHEKTLGKLRDLYEQ